MPFDTDFIIEGCFQICCILQAETSDKMDCQTGLQQKSCVSSFKEPTQLFTFSPQYAMSPAERSEIDYIKIFIWLLPSLSFLTIICLSI